MSYGNAWARSAGALVVLLGGCVQLDPAQAHGRAVIAHEGCGACHEIPGVPGASGTVGPSLEKLALRTYLAGRLVNTPENRARWVQHPQDILPGGAMPDLALSDEDARDVAAYLGSLR